jgi:hypothetical protein
MKINVKYQRQRKLLEDLSLYRKLIGSLIYFTITQLISFMLFNTVNKFMQAPQHLNLLMFVASFNISLAHLVVAYSSAADWADYTLENPLQDDVYFLVMLLSFENARSKITSPSSPLRQSIAPCLLPNSKSCGYVVFSKSLVSSKFTLLHYMMTTLASSKLLLTPSTMSVWSTYRLTSTLFERPLTTKLLHFHISSLLYKSWISSPKLSPIISFSC